MNVALPATPYERAERAIARLIGERHDRPSLVYEIACRIGAEIVEGFRDPGDDLNSVELARLHASSRTPIREALMLLEREGLVEILARRRPRVATFGATEIRDIYLVRSSLLQMAARTIAAEITPEQLQVMDDHLERMRAASGDVSAFMWANVDFHEYQTEICGNAQLRRIVRSLLIRTLPLRRISLARPGRLSRSLEDHTWLVKSYADGDGELAAAIIQNNHMAALSFLQTRFLENG